MTSVEPEEVAVSVFRAHDLRAAKPGRGRFWTVFGTHKTKLQTSTVQENHGSPVWNTQGAIALQQNDRVIKFKVLDGDHVVGQIQLPISQIPRRQEEAHPVTAPLQTHKRCANPSGNLVYSCYVSKFRTASASGSNNQLASGTENQRSNQDSGSSSGRRGSLGVMSSLSSSLTNLVKLRSGSKSGSGRSEEQEAEPSSRPVPKAESRRRADSNLVAAGKSDERRGSQPNLAPTLASTSAVSTQNGTRGAAESTGNSWRVYEVEDAEAASSITAESISMTSNSSLPVGLGALTQRVAPQAPTNANVNAKNAPTGSNVPIGGAPAVFNKPSPLVSSGPSYGSSAYSSGSSYSSNVNVNVALSSTNANLNSPSAINQPSITLTSVGSSTTLSEARMSVSSFDQPSDILTRGRAGSGTPQQTAPVLPSQYQFQKGFSIHGTGVVSGARGSTPAPQSRTGETASMGSTTELTPSTFNFAKRPRVTLIDPTEGSVQGGTKLRICGENLGDQQTDVRAVYVCGSNCIGSLFWRSPNEIIVTTKPWRECTGFVVVETPHGRSNSAVQFSFRDYKIQPTANLPPAQAQAQLQMQQPPSTAGGGLPSAPVRRRLSTAHLGLECETTDMVQVGTNNVSLAVGNGMQNDSQVPAFANPLELTSEICRLRSRVQELETQNVQLRTDGERLQQYIDSLTQKILSRCPELLCADSGADKAKEKQQSKARARSSSLFSLFGVGQKEDEKTTRKDTVEQLRQFASQQSTAANVPVTVNVPTTAPRRSFAPPSAIGASGGGYEPTNPSMIMTNEIMQL